MRIYVQQNAMQCQCEPANNFAFGSTHVTEVWRVKYSVVIIEIHLGWCDLKSGRIRGYTTKFTAHTHLHFYDSK